MPGEPEPDEKLLCPSSSCKIQSFLLEQRVSYWKVSCIIITKRHLVSVAKKTGRGWMVSAPGASPFSALGKIIQNVNNTEEVVADSANIDCLRGHFICI